MTDPGKHGTRARLGVAAGTTLVLLLLASLALMSDATSGSARFGEIFSFLLVVNIIGLLILTGLIGWNLRRLLHQVRTRQAGARLTAKVVAVFVVLAVAEDGDFCVDAEPRRGGAVGLVADTAHQPCCSVAVVNHVRLAGRGV